MCGTIRRSGWAGLAGAIALLGLTLATAVADPAPAKPEAPTEQAKPRAPLAPPTAPNAAYVFLQYCPEKNSEETDRYRICDALMQDALPAKPDAAVYLRKRLDDLAANMRANSKRAYGLYFWTSIAILVAAFVGGVVLVLSERRPARAVALGFGAFLIGVATTFGWLNQYQAEFQGYVKLRALRDDIDVKLVHAAATRAEIKAATVNAWIKDYRGIVAEFSEAYSTGFKLPSGNLVTGG